VDNWPINQTRDQSSRGLLKSRTCQLAAMFDGRLNLIENIALRVISGILHYLYTVNYSI